MLKINLKIDYEAILKIKFVDQLWRSITSEISFEDQNPRYHLEDLDWRSISVTLDICSEDPIDGQTLRLEMAIPWRFSFLEESRSRGMANLHSSGIEEDGIYSSGSLGNFEEWVIQKIIKNLDKHPKNSNKFWKKLKKNSALILYFKVG